MEKNFNFDIEKEFPELHAKMCVEEDSKLTELQKEQFALLRELKYLPRDMKPSREVFEKVGFHFHEMPDSLFLRADFPAGWHIEQKRDNIFVSIIYDDKNRKRAVVNYVFSPQRTFAHMELLCRYSTAWLNYGRDDDDYIEVIDNATDKTLFLAGSGYQISTEQENDFFSQAFAWLEKHYPNFMDPLLYWD